MRAAWGRCALRADADADAVAVAVAVAVADADADADADAVAVASYANEEPSHSRQNGASRRFTCSTSRKYGIASGSRS